MAHENQLVELLAHTHIHSQLFLGVWLHHHKLPQNAVVVLGTIKMDIVDVVASSISVVIGLYFIYVGPGKKAF